MANPLVTIVTPTLNSKAFLEQTLQSVLTQDYEPIEHLFVDGDSTDGTLDILEDYAKRYPGRIRILYSFKGNAIDAWNYGMQDALGEILGWIGSDDQYEPGAIRSVMEYFKSHPEMSVLHGHCHYVKENGKDVLWTHKAVDFTLDYYLNHNMPVAMPSVFFRKEVFLKMGLVDSYACDFEYMLRMAKLYRMYAMDKVLARFRVHSKSDTGGNNLRRRKEVLYICSTYSRKHGGRFFSDYRKRYYLFLLSMPFRRLLGPYFSRIALLARKTILRRLLYSPRFVA